MTIDRFIKLLVCVFGLLLSTTLPAKAEDWQFDAIPYMWMPGIDGDLNLRRHTISFDQSFSDLFEDLHFGVMGRFEAKHEDLILTTDLSYFNLGESGSDGPIDLSANVRQTILEIGGGYHLADFELGDSLPRLSIDGLAGARYFRLRGKIKGPFERDPSTTIDYWEPFIGPRLTLAFNEKWSIGLRTDVGGFSIGNDPEFSWQLTSGVKYQASKLIAIDLGYKFLNIYDLDHKNGSIDYNIGGLILAVDFSF